MITAFYLFVGAVVIMLGLGALGILGGYINARLKERRYLRVFNEDLKRPIMPRSVS